MLTKQQKQAYLASGGSRCPFCGESQLEGGFVEVTTDGASQPITCLSCGRTWHDVHRRADIVVPEEGEPHSGETS
jgi:uncharacterized protein (DUF983 family)